MKVSCFLKDFESYGLFIGGLLSISENRDLVNYKKTIQFYNIVSKELEDFLSKFDYNVENISKWFSRYDSNFLMFRMSTM